MDLWQRVLARLESQLDSHSFNTWFRPTSLAWRDDETLHIAVPNDVFREWLRDHYGGLINEALQELQPGRVSVNFTPAGPPPSPRGEGPAQPLSGAGAGSPRHTLLPPGTAVAPSRSQHPAAVPASHTGAAATIPPAGASDSPAAPGAPLPGSAPASPGAAVIVPQRPVSGPLNPKYRFSSFIVGASNQFAHAAARAVAETPSRAYNPLFLYGGVGLGKTHLMHAIGHHILRYDADLRLVYLSSERFMNELINSIRYDRTFEFRERYRNIDVLLMDDIQFLAGKERTQEEFFHTFNALYDAQRQIVLTSDSPPKEIPTLEERLRSRFEWGLLADIQPPDLETKIAILKKKADGEEVDISDDVLLFIATNSKSNIRELEGALIRLIAYASLTAEQLSVALARTVLRDTLPAKASSITIDRIQQNVAEYFGMRTTELSSRSNARRITQPRQIAMYLCKRLTRHSLPEIGRAFGGKHHSTVIHSVRKVEHDCRTDDEIHRTVNSLLEALQ